MLADDKRSKIDKTEVNVTLFYLRLTVQHANIVSLITCKKKSTTVYVQDVYRCTNVKNFLTKFHLYNF